MRYDPDVSPSSSEWLALDEGERMALVEESHPADDLTAPNVRLHAAIHAAVETQIAMSMPSVVDAVARLREQGLGRHDTIHAIGAVLAEHMWEMAQADETLGDPNAGYYAALDQLTADRWRQQYS